MLMALTIGLISSPFPHDHRPQRVEDDEEVQRKRHVLDVEQVVLELLDGVFLAGSVGIADLRPSGQSWPYDVPLAVERDVPCQLLDEFWPLGPGSDLPPVAPQRSSARP